MKKTIFLLSCMFVGVIYSHAEQDVFKKYGHKKEILTLSKGKYQEVFKNSEVVQIGTVLLNTKTNKVFKLLQEDTTKTSYNAELSSRFLTIDPLAEKYYSVSPYAYCNNNPVNLVDPNGMEWFYHSADGKSDPTWIWHDGSTYNTGVKDSKGKDVVLQGQEAVVVFNGSTNEKLGEGDKMTGKGAVLADVTVYGPNGKDDVQQYKGYSMSSDPKKFGVVADGDYTVNRLKPGEKPGPYGSDLVVGKDRNTRIPEQDNFNPSFPERNPAYLTGVFIHRPNNDGWAGSFKKDGKWHGVSQGCLLIAPNQWNKFHNQLQAVNSFLLQLRRN